MEFEPTTLTYKSFKGSIEYSETCSIKYIQNIIDIYESYGGILVT